MSCLNPIIIIESTTRASEARTVHPGRQALRGVREKMAMMAYQARLDWREREEMKGTEGWSVMLDQRYVNIWVEFCKCIHFICNFIFNKFPDVMNALSKITSLLGSIHRSPSRVRCQRPERYGRWPGILRIGRTSRVGWIPRNSRSPGRQWLCRRSRFSWTVNQGVTRQLRWVTWWGLKTFSKFSLPLGQTMLILVKYYTFAMIMMNVCTCVDQPLLLVLTLSYICVSWSFNNLLLL